MAEQRSPLTAKRWVGFGAGVLAGACFALFLYLLARYYQPDSGLILVSVLLIPAAACALAVIVAGIGGEDSTNTAAWMGAAVVTALILGSVIIVHEGVVCVVMAAPLFYPLGVFTAIGVARLRKIKSARTPTSLAVIFPLLLLPMEQQSAYPTMAREVVTSIEIEAPLAVVWREAIEIRDIGADEESWTLTQDVLRVPKPLDARLIRRDGALVRQATWAGGVQFYEVVTEWRHERAVAWRFDIPEAAANRLLDEHLRLDDGYLQLRGGRYDFEAVSPTRTRLTLTTNYAVRTPLNFYASAWAQLLLGDIHRNVLHVVEQRAEAH